jgi:O-acetyl-ADP-ribose deacetylase (regulator of RNase III)
MKEIQGDLIHMAIAGDFDVIAHSCNCFNTMGSGIAGRIAKELPEAMLADKKTKRGDASKLGTILPVEIERNSIKFIVVNAYGQYNYGTNKVNADYNAIRKCFMEVKKQFSGKRIGICKLGAGLAGGDWTIISKIIEEEMVGEDLTLVLFNEQPKAPIYDFQS